MMDADVVCLDIEWYNILSPFPYSSFLRVFVCVVVCESFFFILTIGFNQISTQGGQVLRFS